MCFVPLNCVTYDATITTIEQNLHLLTKHRKHDAWRRDAPSTGKPKYRATLLITWYTVSTTHILRGSRMARDVVISRICVSVCLSARGRMPTLLHGPEVAWGMVWNAPQLCTIRRFCNRCTGCVAIVTQREREMSASACTRFTLGLL